MKRIPLVVLTVALGVLGSFAASAVAHRSTAGSATVSIRKTGLGPVLVDSRGHTLYLFKKDRRGKSACSSSCAKFWPPLLVRGKPKVGSGVRAALLGITRRAGGLSQVTYNGHPLYAFALDKRPGQTNGEGLLEFGAKWYAVSAKGLAVTSTVAPPPSTSTSTTPCYYPPC